jgi:hypothetical protein
MKYNPKTKDNLLCAITYGSRLYGTQTPTSDYDFKAVYLPSYRDLLLARTAHVHRHRFDIHGNTVPESTTMPDNGYEAEHIPLQKFVNDWWTGQAYAVEMVFAVLQGYGDHHLNWERYDPISDTLSSNQVHFARLCEMLVMKFRTNNVQGMIGFAVKQTFDYVRRGERLNAAKQVLDVVKETYRFPTDSVAVRGVRLDDSIFPDYAHLKFPNHPPAKAKKQFVIDYIADKAELKISSVTNNGKTMRTLELNGRSYLETTAVSHFEEAVRKLADQYGDRSTRASEVDVDWKSLSHAVRVYQQVIEYLETGWITFPRQNAANLLAIKSGEHKIEDVKDLLRDLDDEVNGILSGVEDPDRVWTSGQTPDVVAKPSKEDLDAALYTWLKGQY